MLSNDSETLSGFLENVVVAYLIVCLQFSYLFVAYLLFEPLSGELHTKFTIINSLSNAFCFTNLTGLFDMPQTFSLCVIHS